MHTAQVTCAHPELELPADSCKRQAWETLCILLQAQDIVASAQTKLSAVTMHCTGEVDNKRELMCCVGETGQTI